MSSNQTFTPRFSTPAPAATGTPAAAAAAAAAAHWTPQWNKSRANHVHLSATTSSPLQFATAADHSQFVQERLCFVSHQEKLWPAISFMSFAEYAAYGASVGWTPAQRQQANISFLQQSMNSNSHKNKPTSYVQLLGFSLQDGKHKHFGVSEQFDFTDYLGLSVCALDDPSLFASFEIYQNFAQALDQAYAYLTSSTPAQEGPTNSSFVQKANALWKEHEQQAQAQAEKQPAAATAAPVETPAAQVNHHNQEPALTPMAPMPPHQGGTTTAPFVYETPAMNETIPRAAALIPIQTARRPPFLSPAAGFPQRRRTSSTTTPVMQPNALEGRFDTMQTPVTQNHPATATAGSTPAAASTTTNHGTHNSSPTTITVDSRQEENDDSVGHDPNDDNDTVNHDQNLLQIDQNADFSDITSDLLMTYGWTVDHVDGMIFHLRPGKALETGKPESDYYSQDELKQWLKDSYGWTGPKKSSAKKQQQKRQPSPKKKMVKKKAAAPKKAAASSVKKGRKAATGTPVRTPARPRRAATTPASASEHRYEGYYNFSFLWNHVLKPRGWTYENAKRTNKNPESQFATWCWVMAGYTQDTGQVNQQLFYTEQALVDYCRAMEMEDHPDYAPMGYDNDQDEDDEDEQPSTKKNAKGAARRGRKQQASAGKRRGRPAAAAKAQ